MSKINTHYTPTVCESSQICTASKCIKQTYYHIPRTLKKTIIDNNEFLISRSLPFSETNKRYYNSIPANFKSSSPTLANSENIVIPFKHNVNVPKSNAEYNYKPQPMIRKSKRQFVDEKKKDETYWERRQRNNEAAKRSREQRREKEIEINRKCELLEVENANLKFTVENLQENIQKLEDTVSMYKEILRHQNVS
ncbi:uncharacterized protein LOC100204993 [Hydra vulgaris]|uniref:Uncharacterized protein LOC100204993 n=1 Tax=Hydra vulgaris TaxID=6087 RepID=A0ABM4C8X9_HYDVU